MNYCCCLVTVSNSLGLQAPLSMGFSRQEYWSELTFPFPGGSFWLKDQTSVSCIIGGFFTTEPPGMILYEKYPPPKFNSGEYSAELIFWMKFISYLN